VNRLVIAALLILIILLLYKGCEYKREAQMWRSQVHVGTDSERLRKDYNKLGQEVATITALHQMTVAELESVKADAGSTIARLQKEVSRKTSLASVIRSHTTGEVVTQTDTIYIPVGETLPVYQTMVEDQWSRFDIMASPDTFLIDYKVFNEFVFKAEWKRPSLFKPRYLEASVTSINPNTQTIGLSTWQAPRSKPRRLAWLGVGVAIGVLVGVR